MTIINPYINNYCDVCIHHYLLDGDESRCRATKIGMSHAICVQVTSCKIYKEKIRKYGDIKHDG